MEYHRNNTARALLVIVMFFAIVGAVIWFVYRVTERTIQAVDRRYGDGFWLALALLLFAVVAFVAIGGAVALVRRWSRHVRAKDGLFPVLDTRRGIVNPNEAGAQTLAALAGASRRVSAPTAARVIDAHYRGGPAVEPMPALPEPGPVASYPRLASVYDAALPARLALPVGVAGAGDQVALPLRGLGNVVIGGLPNSGKSELLASMLAGLLRQDATGQRSQVAVVDMKLVSFGNLPALAALRWPVATEIDEAHQVIAAARAECARRYELLRSANSRTLDEYRARTGDPLPYITVLVDEIADLTQDEDRGRRDRFLAAATEIARKGRAAGLGLVMATQRPSADVLPSSLRNLAGAAVAFRVSRNHDSIAVLGEPGAEALPAVPGRCLVRHAGVVEVQAFYAGLEGGRFDGFLERLPRGEQQVIDVEPVAVDGWPVREPGEPAVYRPAGGVSSGIPAFDTAQRTAYTPEQIAHIRRLHHQLGSIKAVQRELYDGQEGGHWFYKIREAIGA